ncbi:MAG: calcineurin-like phosphoesterase C-terminal domain-containing protein [Bacteroidales bacterium]|nr:calcineurin-like phosphoesterase C-terminal domain-containing protein [Bacteroidales bacterium]
MKKLFIILPLLALLYSCDKETDMHPGNQSDKVVFVASIPQTKTVLGEKDGSSWPLLWSAGDAISVNGVTSSTLNSSKAGLSSASFSVDGVSAPYYAASPASAVSGYSNGRASVSIPSEQTFVDGSFDPAAYVLLASSDDENLEFSSEVALFSITPVGSNSASITSIRLTSIGGVPLSGAFSTDWSGLTAGQESSPTVQMTYPDGVPLGTPWIIAIAAADLTQDGLEVIVTDGDGGVMKRKTKPSKAYEAGKMYTAQIPYTPDFYGNIYGTVTCNGSPVEGVLVSDGIDIVETDSHGHYAIQSEKKWENVFVIIPSGYEVPKDGVMPRHYKPLTQDFSVPEQADFELVAVDNNDFRLLVLGDMHLAGLTGDLDQFANVSGTIQECIETAFGKVYGLTLGDHAWDMYWVSNSFGLPEYVSTMNTCFGTYDFPVFHTMGNADNDMESAGDIDKSRRYVHTVAPTYYSFNIGGVHFIVLDDLDFTGVPEGRSHIGEYRKNFCTDQLEWLRKDLSHVDKSTLVVVSAHEPMAIPDGLRWKEELNGPDADMTMFQSIFDGYEVHLLTGHTHCVFNREYAPTFHEHNFGAVCGTWWWSGYLTPGIHIGQDGSPGGIGVFDFDGNTVSNQYYLAACHNRNYQFRAYDMNKVKEFLTDDYAGGHPDWTKYYDYIQGFGDNVIFVNVWDWDEDWRVEILEGDTQLDVTRVGGAYDPLHLAAFTGPRLRRSDAQGTSPSFQTRDWNHFFKATASSANSTITVKVTDRYGNLFMEEMVRPKAFQISDYENE